MKRHDVGIDLPDHLLQLRAERDDLPLNFDVHFMLVPAFSVDSQFDRPRSPLASPAYVGTAEDR